MMLEKQIIDAILVKNKLYKHCILCGNIYDEIWEVVYAKNGNLPLGKEFNSYNISSSVCKQRECMDKFDGLIKHIKELKEGRKE